MLIYNGAALEDIAPAQIVDITVSPVKQKVTSRSRAILSGEDFVRIRGETRTIKVTFALLTQDTDASCSALVGVHTAAAPVAAGPANAVYQCRLHHAAGDQHTRVVEGMQYDLYSLRPVFRGHGRAQRFLRDGL